MIIQTKYNVGQSVFTIIYNKVAEVYIRKITLEVEDNYGSKPPIVKATYYAAEKYKFFRQKALPYNETELYSTKQELLQHI